MSEPYIKVMPLRDVPRDLLETEGLFAIIGDKEGANYFERLIDRAERRKADSPGNFKAWKDRVKGSFLALGVVMGWARK